MLILQVNAYKLGLSSQVGRTAFEAGRLITYNHPSQFLSWIFCLWTKWLKVFLDIYFGYHDRGMYEDKKSIYKVTP